MNTLNYKGYTARIKFDERDNILIGRLIGIKDIICFHADNVTDLRLAFKDAVDDYLEACEKIGKLPEKLYSGKLMLRVSPEIHAHAALMAETQGKSLNQWAADVLGNAR